MNTIILALAVLSGYIYVINSVAQRYVFKRSEGWSAYFYVAAWGVLFTIISWVFCSALCMLDFFRMAYRMLIGAGIIKKESMTRMFPLTPSSEFKFADFKFSLFCVISMLIALIAGVLNRWINNRNQDLRIEALIKAVYHDPFESMLIEGAVRKFPLIITLRSKKIYVGMVDCPRFEHGKIDYLQLLPLISGYRNKDDLTVHITTNYKRYYVESGIVGSIGNTNLKFSDFRTLIPKTEIEGISFFDTEAYSQFKINEQSDRQNCNALDKKFMPVGLN